MSRVSRPRLAAAATVLALGALTTACNADTETGTSTGGDNTTAAETDDPSSEPTDPAGSSEPTEPTEPAETTSESSNQQIDVTVTGDSVTPSGDSVDVPLGEPVDLVVTADVAGEIHVHSDPEQYFEFEPGEQTFTLTIDRPGVVEVERHDPDLLIVQLTVQ